jgi:hypothetical protein
MLCAYVRSLELVGIISRKRCCLCVWFFSCCLCCNRGRVRRRYLIQGKPGDDFACSYCCCPCDCFRVMLEIQHREDRYVTWFYGVREGYHENVNSVPCTGQVAPAEEGDAAAVAVAAAAPAAAEAAAVEEGNATTLRSGSEHGAASSSSSSSGGGGGSSNKGASGEANGASRAWASPTADMAR